jgi:hypothetical protein
MIPKRSKRKMTKFCATCLLHTTNPTNAFTSRGNPSKVMDVQWHFTSSRVLQATKPNNRVKTHRCLRNIKEADIKEADVPQAMPTSGDFHVPIPH